MRQGGETGRNRDAPCRTAFQTGPADSAGRTGQSSQGLLRQTAAMRGGLRFRSFSSFFRASPGSRRGWRRPPAAIPSWPGRAGYTPPPSRPGSGGRKNGSPRPGPAARRADAADRQRRRAPESRRVRPHCAVRADFPATDRRASPQAPRRKSPKAPCGSHSQRRAACRSQAARYPRPARAAAESPAQTH